MLNIGIIGYGVVGQALAYGFEGYPIKYHDKFKDSYSLAEVAEFADIIFVCVPTPMKKNENGIDLSIMHDVIHELTQFTDNTDKIVVIKSTVVPGTTRTYQSLYPNTQFAMNPEFLTEANYLQDFITAKHVVIGSESKSVALKVGKLYRHRFPHIKVITSDATTAEMVKYMTNTYLALKVAYANEIYDLCRQLGIDYQNMKNIVVEDERIFNSHLDITDNRGYGGKCFPKDTVALIGRAKELGVDLSIIKTAWEKNKKIRQVWDWLTIPFAT